MQSEDGQERFKDNVAGSAILKHIFAAGLSKSQSLAPENDPRML